MMGFEITFRAEKHQFASKDLTSILVFQRFGHFYLEVVSIEKESNETYRWIDTKINLGENIKIEVKNINRSSSPSPVKEKTKISELRELSKRQTKEMYKEQILKFHEIEKILKREGLIEGSFY